MYTSKTLLAILVEELPKRGGWPEGVKWLAQTPGGSILGREIYQSGPHFSLVLDTVADDYRTAKVMREQYEAALAEKGIHTVKVECQVVDADGWIDWAGGECPVEEGTLVDVKQRDNWVDEGSSAGNWQWKHFGNHTDIIAYRLHQPQDATSRANDERLEADLNDCIGQAPGAPQWDGQGLPPVGCECEVKSPRHGWTKAIVTAVTDNWLIAQYPDGAEFASVHRLLEDDGTFTYHHDGFRPATFERDELAAAMEQSADKHRGFVDVFKLVADDLMAAGYRKQ